MLILQTALQRLQSVTRDERTRADRHQADVQSKHQCDFEQPPSEVNRPKDRGWQASFVVERVRRAHRSTLYAGVLSRATAGK